MANPEQTFEWSRKPICRNMNVLEWLKPTLSKLLIEMKHFVIYKREDA